MHTRRYRKTNYTDLSEESVEVGRIFVGAQDLLDGLFELGPVEQARLAVFGLVGALHAQQTHCVHCLI